MSLRNHSNFPGALWRTDNSVRGVPFLFFTPPSLPLTCSHFHFSLERFARSSHLTGFSLTRPACFLRALWSSNPRASRMQLQTAADIIARRYLSKWLSELFENFNFVCVQKAALCWHRQKCAPKALSQLVIPLSTFQRLCCQTMVLPPRLIALRICNA